MTSLFSSSFSRIKNGFTFLIFALMDSKWEGNFFFYLILALSLSLSLPLPLSLYLSLFLYVSLSLSFSLLAQCSKLGLFNSCSFPRNQDTHDKLNQIPNLVNILIISYGFVIPKVTLECNELSIFLPTSNGT